MGFGPLRKSTSTRPTRLWPSTVVGGTELKEHTSLFRDVSERMNPGQIPLITTAGFEFYKKVIGRMFKPACLYGQVIKTRRSDRIVKDERRIVIGGAWGQQQALRDRVLISDLIHHRNRIRNSVRSSSG